VASRSITSRGMVEEILVQKIVVETAAMGVSWALSSRSSRGPTPSSVRRSIVLAVRDLDSRAYCGDRRDRAHSSRTEDTEAARQRLTANPVRQKMVLRMVWERKTWIRLLRTGIEKINLQNEPTNLVQGSKRRSVSAD